MPSIVTSYNPALAGVVDARATDALSWVFAARPQAMTLYVRFQERGTVLLGNGTQLLVIGSNSVGLNIMATGAGTYKAVYATSVTSRTVTHTTNPVPGQCCEILVSLSATGVLSSSIAVQGGTVSTPASAAALGLPVAWAAQTLTVHSSAMGAMALLNLVVQRGVQDMATMRRLAGVGVR